MTVRKDGQLTGMFMSRINKKTREIVRNKYGGRCAYCGVPLSERFQVDHIKPKLRGGTHEIDNLNPACARCNNWKLWYTVEEYRSEIAAQHSRLLRDQAGYRLAHDFDQIEPTTRPVVFWFEIYQKG